MERRRRMRPQQRFLDSRGNSEGLARAMMHLHTCWGMTARAGRCRKIQRRFLRGLHSNFPCLVFKPWCTYLRAVLQQANTKRDKIVRIVVWTRKEKVYDMCPILCDKNSGKNLNGPPRTVRKAFNSERRTARLPLGSTYLPGFMGFFQQQEKRTTSG